MDVSSVYKDERFNFMAFRTLSHLLSSIERNPELPVSSVEVVSEARRPKRLNGLLVFGANASSEGAWSVEIGLSQREGLSEPTVIRLFTLHVKGGAEQAAMTIDILQDQFSQAA